MTLLVDYIHPLTNWLQANPSWSLFITFLIALAESLAIIGSIVPGSVTMTAIGIMAGSGIMRIDLTLLAAILGAIAGDSLSYLLGYYYSERLSEIWPFSKYPHWLRYGKEFFAIHGGKSVLIGRFIGPLRSIIPVIAGILHMKKWRFFFANTLSAIGWSLLYVMPGVIIGAASHELSTESATRMFVLILLILAGLWLFSLMVKWTLIKLNSFFKRNLHDFWLKLKNSPVLKYVFDALTPKSEENYYRTASLSLTACTCLLCFMIILILKIKTHWLSDLNIPAYLFVQSFHTLLLKAFFIFCTQLTSTISLLSIFLLNCIWSVYHKRTRVIIYLFSVVFFSGFITLALNYCIDSPRPYGLLVTEPGSSFPPVNLSVATALFGFLLFYVNKAYSIFGNTPRSIVFSILGLSGLGAIYLGDYWLTDVLAAYFIGATISLIHCLIYRKFHLHTKKSISSTPLFLLLIMNILLPTSVISYFNYSTLSYNHTPYHKEFSISEKSWWNQQDPILPIYRLSRIGKRISLLNIQYAGDLTLLQNNLEKNGWKTHTGSFFGNLLTRISNQSNSVKLPLLTQLYENRAPVLIMTYTDTKSKIIFELRLWESNYNLTESNRPLWIGSVHPGTPENKKLLNNLSNTQTVINPLPYMLPPENPFSVKRINLPSVMVKTTDHQTPPYIILIKK